MVIKKNIMKNTCFILCILLIGVLTSCKEDTRFAILSNDKTPPSPPKYLGHKPIVGGATIFYKIPNDEDILSINAEYTNIDGKKYTFSSSFFVDSLNVLGFADTEEHTVELYALDRAGNRSTLVPIKINALESALQNVVQSIKVTPAFNSILVSWQNFLQQAVNIYIDMTFEKEGKQREVSWVLSSKEADVQQTVKDILLLENESLNVNIRVSDTYGNVTEKIQIGQVEVKSDVVLSKENWKLPNSNDSIAGIPMCFGDAYEARSSNVINGIISRGAIMDIMHTGGRGRTGKTIDGNAPWNFIIDLGGYYELSRIVTNQRHDISAVAGDPNTRGFYYQGGNVNKYNMYFLDEETGEWEFISQHEIEVPTGISNIEFAKKGAAGDMALMYPNTPAFTKPTRWFRYEALSGFSGTPNVLSEITLYGKKHNQ